MYNVCMYMYMCIVCPHVHVNCIFLNLTLFYLSFISVPLPIIKLNNSMIVDIATPIILNCSVTVPSSLSGMITNITWYFGSTIVTDGVSTMLNQGESTLNLGTIKTAQAGSYTCETRVVSLYIDMDTDVSSSATCNISIQCEYTVHVVHVLLLLIIVQPCTCIIVHFARII